ncbi:hypothetical protein [Novosphingopyxis sp. YJ-S2-01]|uniref:hypothetical protein n=1 Tax=Novosphingopyxis sp. YJ-S2-01 TaxID=2794021 RepID=UPI0018DE3EB3|nr:hypothetical protein [Novosphingopyxis sp. YJ-S2-01]MBH9537551.1 hypothetical protein [Novosphingopyxis sp. YJ-S2-01]
MADTISRPKGAKLKDARRLAIIADYEVAYKAANGRSIQVDYWRGWYSIATPSVQIKCREREIIKRTETLRAHLSQHEGERS